MKDRKDIKIFVLVIVICALLGLTLAYAALSQNLTINGTATVEKSDWDVRLVEEGMRQETRGDAVITSAPTISSDGKSVDLNVSLKKPDDVATFFFKIVNNGDIDARLNDIYINGYSSKEIDEITQDPNFDYSNPDSWDEKLKSYAKSICGSADFNNDGSTSMDECKKAFEYLYSAYSTGRNGIMEIPAKGSDQVMYSLGFHYDATDLPGIDLEYKFNVSYEFVQDN